MSWQKTPKAGVKWRHDAVCLGANAGTRNEESKTKSNKFIYLKKKKNFRIILILCFKFYSKKTHTFVPGGNKYMYSNTTKY